MMWNLSVYRDRLLSPYRKMHLQHLQLRYSWGYEHQTNADWRYNSWRDQMIRFIRLHENFRDTAWHLLIKEFMLNNSKTWRERFWNGDCWIILLQYLLVWQPFLEKKDLCWRRRKGLIKRGKLFFFFVCVFGRKKIFFCRLLWKVIKIQEMNQNVV